jgi:hypothetical protein
MRGVAATIAILCLRGLAQEPLPCTIGGTVVDAASNKPVARARVIAQSGAYSFLRLTDDTGGFCFEKLAPNDYHVSVQKAGYEEALHPVTLAVEEGSVVKPVTMRIVRYATLSGTVLDAIGEPLPGAEVTVWERAPGKYGGGPDEVDGTTADRNGAFRISELTPGTYYLSVKPSDREERRFVFPFADSHGQFPREKEVETFYSASFTFADANAVEVKAGQQVGNLVLTLKKAPLRRVTGRIANPPRSGFLYFDGETETGSEGGGAIPIGKDGSFAKAGLLPAKYIFRLNDGQRPIAQAEVDLTGGDALGITLEPIETVDVPVTFRTEGKGPAFRPRTAGEGTTVLMRDGSGEGLAMQTADDGTYRFAGVPRGIYRLSMGLAGQRLYLKGVTYGGETQTGNKVDLRTAREGGLEVTFSSNVAELQGRVKAAEDESADLTVILVDEAKDGGSVRIAGHAGTDQKGRFRMAGVAPGKYRLFAIEGFDDDRWGSPELAKVLEAKSVELELKESDKKQVSVTVISAGEWAAAVKKIGG